MAHFICRLLIMNKRVLFRVPHSEKTRFVSMASKNTVHLLLVQMFHILNPERIKPLLQEDYIRQEDRAPCLHYMVGRVLTI
ncbi:hypothetical protein SDC9_141440 [bioreactor metagenome]|uniref:Uncharacterized protein n=1 Tax=bioreactor metagenome TaxID=1076179 RepID=A0A645DXN7_9ZZZZ